ncbi:peptidylprolyl isomerase [Aurantiacibacter poecillastricola]|uniref:peptidylprolyl isomerase n=1 Tax=Aurantiacibacter poecillastricola TaxID=3064385 RepID=UPI00273FDD8F|nr:peptidylprolyl isomerase [Aurantiacibacter sp. 219JJ12-13]MDP5263447.1 peptidylprolyl isomerase [Aurantiacibacter sp. 219JJ12-13]
MKRLLALTAILSALPLAAQEGEEPATPSAIVDAASAEEWVEIPPEDLLVMELAPDARGPRTVVIQLMPAPFSQPWVENIRALARAHWWDGTSVYRVQDNYVTQWGDSTEERPLPEGVVSPVAHYEVDGDRLSEATFGAVHLTFEYDELPESVRDIFDNPNSTQDEQFRAVEELVQASRLGADLGSSDREERAMLSINATQTRLTEQGWHQRDGFAQWVEFWRGWPIANDEKAHWENELGKVVDDPGRRHPPASYEAPYKVVDRSTFWPLHCYGHVGVARDYAPDTGTGAELYTIIGQPQRHMDRNLAVVGRVIAGMEHLSSLPRGSGELGFYTDEEADLRTPIFSVRLASEMGDPPTFEYLATDSASFARYLQVRASRDDPFYTVPAGGVDVCSVQVPIRRAQ